MATFFQKIRLAAILLGCFAGAVSPLRAQETAKPRLHLRHELGVNATSFLDKVFRFNLDSAVGNPYLLTYRVSMGNIGLHVGAGGTHHYQRSSQDGYRDSDTERQTGFDARFGVDYRLNLGRRFSGQFGLDGVGKWRRFKKITDSGFDVVTRVNQFNGWGGGPTVGLTFWINKHLGLSTEAAYYMVFGTNERARTFKNFPELDDEIFTDKTEDFTTILPANLFLIYRF